MPRFVRPTNRLSARPCPSGKTSATVHRPHRQLTDLNSACTVGMFPALLAAVYSALAYLAGSPNRFRGGCASYGKQDVVSESDERVRSAPCVPFGFRVASDTNLLSSVYHTYRVFVDLVFILPSRGGGAERARRLGLRDGDGQLGAGFLLDATE
jgi:hypothetical protein